MAEHRNLRVVYLEVVRDTRSADGCSIHKYEFLRHFAQLHPRTAVICSREVRKEDLMPADCTAIETSGNLAALYLRYAFALLRLSRQTRFDVVYARTSLYSLIGSLLVARLGNVPLVCEVNGLSDDEYAVAEACRTRRSIGLAHRLDRWLARVSEQYVLRHAQAVVAVTERLGDLVRERVASAEIPVHVIENGANTDHFVPMERAGARSALGMQPDGPVVCFVGNFAPWQGVEHLIDAAPAILQRFPATRFLLVGDGLMRDAWQQRAAERGISHACIFTGRVPYTDVPAYIGASDICVAPFTGSRNEKIGLSPLKMYEYLACARPIVASGISGITELLDRSAAGIAVPPENPHALAEAVVALLDDPRRQGEMGERGASYARAHHSWASVASQISAVCTSVTRKS